MADTLDESTLERLIRKVVAEELDKRRLVPPGYSQPQHAHHMVGCVCPAGTVCNSPVCPRRSWSANGGGNYAGDPALSW